MRFRFLILFFTICFCPATFAQQNNNIFTQKLKSELNKRQPNGDSVKAFLKHGAYAGTRHIYGKTMLHFAAQMADLELVKMLLNDSLISVNDANNKQHETPLHSVTNSKYFICNKQDTARAKIVKLLLQKGARVDVKDKLGNTALQNESISGNADILKMLVDAGSKVVFTEQEYNRYNYDIFDRSEIIIPVVEAARNGNLQALKYLIGLDTFYYDRLLALNAAAENGNLEALNFLLGKTPLLKKDSNNQYEINRLFSQQGRAFAAPDFASGNYALAMASKNGHYEVAKRLLQQGVPVNIADVQYNNNTPPINYAVTSGNYELVKLLIENGADLNRQDPYVQGAKNALGVAAENNQLQIAELLIRSGADVNYHINYNVYSSPIMYASQKGHLQMVKLLIQHGANVNSPQPYYNPIFLAINNAHKAVVELLLDSINIKANPAFLTGALTSLISIGKLETFSFLLEKGVAPDFETGETTTPLMYAAMYNQPDFAKILLQYGADVNRKDYNSHTALDYAFSTEMEELLKSHGAVNNKKFNYKKSYTQNYISKDSSEIDKKLAHAIYSAPNAYAINLDSVKSYIRQGANVHISGFAKIGLVTLAALRLDEDLLKLLLEHGADINENNKYDMPLTAVSGFPRLFGATAPKADSFHAERVKMAALLLKNGADVNLRPKYGMSPLYAAVLSGNVALAKLMVESGAPLKGKYNSNLLTSAVNSGNIEMLEYLLIRNVKRNRRNVYAIVEAGRSGRTDMIKMLLENGFTADDVSKSRYAAKYTALYYAVQFNDLEMTQLLLKNGASVNPNPDAYLEYSPIYIAAKNKDDEIIGLFIKYGYKLSGPLKKNEPSLMYAAVQKCDTALIKTLLKHGADINIRNEENYTPYNLAKNGYNSCADQNFSMANWLLKLGADSSIKYTPVTGKGFSIGSKHVGLGFGSFGKYSGIKFCTTEKDTLINGLSLSFWGSKGKYMYQSTINGLQTAFYSEAGNVNGVSINILAADNEENTGLMLTGGVAIPGTFHGVNLAGLFSYSYDFTGISISGIGQGFEQFYGIAVSPVNVNYNSTGFVLGGFNFLSGHKGIVVGGVNALDGASTYGLEGKGFLLGALNLVSGYSGFQLGVLNLPYSRRNYVHGGNNGLQMGLVNYGRMEKGVQIGLLNINPEKKHFKVMPLVNFRFVKKQLH